MSKNINFLVLFLSLGIVQSFLAGSFTEKFTDLVDHAYVTLKNDTLTINKKTRSDEITSGLILSGLSLCYAKWACSKIDGNEWIWISGFFSGFFGVAGICASLGLIPRVDKLILSKQGMVLEQGTKEIISWKDVTNICIEDLEELKINNNTIKTAHKGRRLVVMGEYRARLLVIDEENTWLPIKFNDLIRVMESYFGEFGPAAVERSEQRSLR